METIQTWEVSDEEREARAVAVAADEVDFELRWEDNDPLRLVYGARIRRDGGDDDGEVEQFCTAEVWRGGRWVDATPIDWAEHANPRIPRSPGSAKARWESGLVEFLQARIPDYRTQCAHLIEQLEQALA